MELLQGDGASRTSLRISSTVDKEQGEEISAGECFDVNEISGL